jgi:starch synthase
MEILFVASEVAPYSKTGGLGDVVAGLSAALAARGHRVAVVSPRYGSIDPERHGLVLLDRGVEARGEQAGLWAAPGKPEVYLLEHERHFGGRPGPYGEAGGSYEDNDRRFAFLARAALAVPAAVGLRPRIVHLHDWQTALGAWLLRHERGEDPCLRGARSVFTIHNLAYQGLFPRERLPGLGLPWEAFRYDGVEFHGQLSFMKAGLAFADVLTTVSPNYAREILAPESGAGLDAVLRHRQHDLHGILNGIDAGLWNPATDPHLAARFRRGQLGGKAVCKGALQRELGLPLRTDAPLVAMVSRLVDQKGIDLVAASLNAILDLDLQMAVLGSGDRRWEELFAQLAREHPERLRARVGFDEGLAHRIEAGADLFLMPSRYEPCGLNQMYSLRYGTVPVVRAVGGLEDTVEDYDGLRHGTGFKFRPYEPPAMMTALLRALDVYRDAKAWRGLQDRGMALDFSWDASAARYEELYRELEAG